MLETRPVLLRKDATHGAAILCEEFANPYEDALPRIRWRVQIKEFL